MTDIQKAMLAARDAIAAASYDESCGIRCATLADCVCYKEARVAVLAFLKTAPDYKIVDSNYTLTYGYESLAHEIEEETPDGW